MSTREFRICSEQREALVNNLGLFQIRLEDLGGGATTEKFYIFFLHLNWHKIVMEIWTFLFLEHWQFNHKLCPPLSYKNILCLKDSPHNLGKYEIKRTSKIPISLLFSELETILKYNELGEIYFPLGKNEF